MPSRILQSCDRGRQAILAGVAGFALAVPMMAAAQPAPSASRVAPDSLAPIRPMEDGSITLPERVAGGAPAGADNLSIKVGGVIVEDAAGNAPAGATAAISAVSGELAGRTVSVATLYAAAARIEEAYNRAGQVLTRVTLPPQHLTDGGSVHLMVVEGFIESVDATQLPARVREVVRRRAAGLVGVRGLSLAEIERRVLLAGDVPGVQLRSALVRGSAPGATRLVLSGAYRPVSGGLSVENNLGAAYRHEAFTVDIAANSVFGLGEQIYLQATSGPDLGHLFQGDSVRRILGAGASVPIGQNGLVLSPEYTRVDTNPVTAAGAPQVTGLFERFAFKASYPLVRTRRENLSITAGFELSRESATAKGFGITLSEDKLRVATLGADYARSLGKAVVVNAGGVLGIGFAGLGARTQADANASGVPFSRLGSGPDFRKLNGHLRFDGQLGGGIGLALITRMQLSLSDALPASAQFSMDGADSLSSFAQGTVSVDSGVTERLELSRPVALGFMPHSLITPYAFGTVAYGHLYSPTALEAADIHSWAGGAGLRLLLGAGDIGVSSAAAVEISHGHVTTPAGLLNSGRDDDPTRVTASIRFRF